MAYDGKLLARARERQEQRREANRNEQQRRLTQVYARVPEIRDIDDRLRGHMAKLVQLTLSRRSDMQEQLAALEKENLDLQMRRAELLTEHGWPVDYLDEIVSCRLCRDSGMVDGHPCACVDRLYKQELTKELSGLLRHGDESFERFDLTLYSDQPGPTGLVPREAMQINFAICKRFSENFPEVSRSLLLWGGTGVGKTYLSACIARVVAAKGCSVCYDTAASALDAFERQKFSRDAEEAESEARRVRRMLSCDLMILDDLGTEMVTSVSVSALYTLINTRLIEGKKTVINTNLSPEELRKKYSPQIASRIEGEFEILPFVGDDIRRLRKR